MGVVHPYKNLSVGIIGMGRTGTALAKYLNQKAKKLYLLDQNKNITFPNIAGAKVCSGEKYLDCLTELDLVFVSPGVGRDKLEAFKSVQSGKTRLSSEIELLFDLLPNKIVGITGSNGKTTTVSLLAHILKTARKPHILGGNIGDPLIDDLGKIKKDDLILLELSSFQLEYMQKSPKLAVILNISPNHLDRHFNMKNYTEAKKNIILHQNAGDIAVLNADDPKVVDISKGAKGDKVWFTLKTSPDKAMAPVFYPKASHVMLYDGENEQIICSIQKWTLQGKHNLANLLAAVAAATNLGIKKNQIEKAVSTVTGLEHRIEYVGNKGGVEYYNDSKATTPEATSAALNSFGKKVVLISGGRDKGLDYSILSTDIFRQAKKVILFGEAGKKIKKALLGQYPQAKANIVECFECDLAEIVKRARKTAAHGDLVLFSPAAASFDMFKDYEDRGNQFKKLVK